MATFIDFTRSVDGTPVSVNPDHVAKVHPEPNDPKQITIIRMYDGDEFGVQGEHKDVVKKLSGA